MLRKEGSFMPPGLHVMKNVFSIQKREFFLKVKEAKELRGGVRRVRRTRKLRKLTLKLWKKAVFG